MTYNLKEHGDELEKQYSDFISEYFPSYENVWKLYIGNIGSNIKATVPNYPIEREERRQAFSEHTYTVLQSIILMKRLLDNNSFEFSGMPDFEQRMRLQNDILLFYTHSGRVYDNTLAAAKCLLNINMKDLEKGFTEFYHQRHIPVHGRILPIVYKKNGEIEMPVLSKSDEDPAGWNHKVNNWPDILTMPIQSISISANKLFQEILPFLNNIFGGFKDIITEELNAKDYKLLFEYQITNEGYSGTNLESCVDVYGIKNLKGYDSSSFNRNP